MFSHTHHRVQRLKIITEKMKTGNNKPQNQIISKIIEISSEISTNN